MARRRHLYLFAITMVMGFAIARTTRPISHQLQPAARLTVEQYISLRRRWCEARSRLVCSFSPTTNSTVSGTVLFAPVWSEEKRDCHTSITARVTGLTSNTAQAMHIHSYGDISSPDGKSCGGHFSSPSMRKIRHGMPDDQIRHWGDFGSLRSDENGNAMYYREDSVISLNGIVGRGMIIHRDMDKGRASQPSGGAGPRKAMCVIGYSNPQTKLDA